MPGGTHAKAGKDRRGDGLRGDGKEGGGDPWEEQGKERPWVGVGGWCGELGPCQAPVVPLWLSASQASAPRVEGGSPAGREGGGTHQEYTKQRKQGTETASCCSTP